jgi:hypothetical protein
LCSGVVWEFFLGTVARDFVYKIRRERELAANRPRESLQLSISGSLCVFK